MSNFIHNLKLEKENGYGSITCVEATACPAAEPLSTSSGSWGSPQTSGDTGTWAPGCGGRPPRIARGLRPGAGGSRLPLRSDCARSAPLSGGQSLGSTSIAPAAPGEPSGAPASSARTRCGPLGPPVGRCCGLAAAEVRPTAPTRPGPRPPRLGGRVPGAIGFLRVDPPLGIRTSVSRLRKNKPRG